MAIVFVKASAVYFDSGPWFECHSLVKNPDFEKIGPIIKNQAVNLQTNKVKVRQRIKLFLVVVLLMFTGEIFAQQKTDSVLNKKSLSQAYFPVRIVSITPDFYSKNLGFFCKKEILLEKKISVPFRFRLGTLEYVNKLEGKK